MDEVAFTSRGSSSAKTIESYRQSEYLCDVVIISEDGRRFPAHRVILAAASQFFSRMFGGSFLESNKTDVAIQNVDGAVLNMLIDFAYKGEAMCPANVENVLFLYEAAHYTQFDELFQMCSDWLMGHVDTSNCLSMAIVADRYDDSNLRREADCISAVNILDLSESEEFLCLSVEHLSRIIAQDDLGVKSEDNVLILVRKWVKHDEASRRDDVQTLSKYIRFPLLHFEETSDVLSDLDLVSHYHTSDGSYRHRVGYDGVLLVAGGVKPRAKIVTKYGSIVKGHKMSSEARIYNAHSKRWSEFPSLPVERCEHRIVTSCGELYSLGGNSYCDTESGTTAGTTEVVHRFDYESRQWVDDVEPMSCPRKGYEIVSSDSRIYGMTIEHSRKKATCEVFDPEKKRWITVSSPKQSFTKPYILSILDNKVYAIGVNIYEGLGYMKYDTVENRWCEFRPCASNSSSELSLIVDLVDPSSCFFATTRDRIYIHSSKSRNAAVFDSCNERFSFVGKLFVFPDCNGLAYDFESKRMYHICYFYNALFIYDERAKKWYDDHIRGFTGDCLVKFPCAVVDRKLLNFV